MKKHRFYFVFCLIFLELVLLSNASAHKVNIFAYTEGDTIFTESYFNDGAKCRKSTITVFDTQGTKLVEGTTDNNGEFSFKIPAITDLMIVLDAGMGHKSDILLSASELDEKSSLEKTEIKHDQQKTIEQIMPTEKTTEQLRSMFEDVLEEKLRPINRQLAKSQEHKISFTEIFGGIGYIFGLMGIVIYFKNKTD